MVKIVQQNFGSCQISTCDKQYNTWNNLRVSSRPHNHYDHCTKEAENSPSWNWIYGTAEYLDNETADNFTL